MSLKLWLSRETKYREVSLFNFSLKEMAAVNEWLNGYLEAILDVGSSVKEKKNDGKVKNFAKFEQEKHQREEKLFNPTTKYFVEEVVNSFNEHDLYRTWVKVRLKLPPSLYLASLNFLFRNTRKLISFNLCSLPFLFYMLIFRGINILDHLVID